MKRSSYTSKMKIEVVQYALQHGNRAASRHFDVSETSVREWKAQEKVLKILPSNQRARRGRKPLYEELEEELFKAIINARKSQYRVSTTMIKLEAKKIFKNLYPDSKTIFKASNHWCLNFMKRKDLRMRAVTSVGQHLPVDWMIKLDEFQNFIIRNSQNIKAGDIGNVDEVPVSFDMPSRFTVDQKGSQDVSIKTTGGEKSNFTVLLGCTAEGGKLPPMLIFKRKTIPKGNFPKGIIIQANEKGWINSELFIHYSKTIWPRRRGSIFSKESLLIFDSARAHLTEEIKSEMKKLRIIPGIIPGGLTKKLQPLDLAINRSFKSKLRQMWEKWMIEGFHTFTKGGKMKRASYEEIACWVNDAWNDVSPDTIKNGFLKVLFLFYSSFI